MVGSRGNLVAEEVVLENVFSSFHQKILGSRGLRPNIRIVRRTGISD